MRLLEYQGKELFRAFSIPVPEGYVVRSADEVAEVSGPTVVKAQVLVGGRGKVGGVRFASTTEQTRQAAEDVLAMEISGLTVDQVLIEPRLNIDRELYLSISLDRGFGLPVLMAIGDGGMDVETVDPSRIGMWHIHPFVGMPDYIPREVGRFLKLSSSDLSKLDQVVQGLWTLYTSYDCEMAEINPLVRTADSRLIAADSKVTIDEDALFRHPDLEPAKGEYTALEQRAKEKGIALVQLDGRIGVIANGAGLTMATLDNLSLHGARGGAFLDLGGTDDPKKVEEALEIMVETNPSAVLINIFGGITKCDTVAEGVVQARKKFGLRAPLVTRIRGVNEDRARDILHQEGITALTDLDEACREAGRLGAER
jgi:succinyl-CoA synthetase beta subunit